MSVKFTMRCIEITERWDADRVWYTATFSPHMTGDIQTFCCDVRLRSSTPFRSYVPGGLYLLDLSIKEM